MTRAPSAGAATRKATALAVLALSLIVAGAPASSRAWARSPSHRSPAHAAKPTATPFGFVGMNVDGPLFNPADDLSPVFQKMEASGVESVRTVFDWAAAQPAAGGPIDFTGTDQQVGLAAAQGLTVLPVVIYTPDWDAAPHVPGTLAIPVDDAPYAAYLGALVRRYGPTGSYWTQHPQTARQPIRMWQIWNEPNFTYFWPATPFAPGYVRLLVAAHAAIKQADPGAKIVLAGFPDAAWQYLAQVYAVGGASRDFDVVAVHPYTQQPANVIRFLQRVRGVMKGHGDGTKPLMVTETGWNSTAGQNPGDNYCCQTSKPGQVRDIKAELPLLAANRKALKLIGFYFYTWAAQEYRGAPSFNFAGLFDFTGSRLVAKPAYSAFRQAALAMERCRRKGRTAAVCLARSS